MYIFFERVKHGVITRAIHPVGEIQRCTNYFY